MTAVTRSDDVRRQNRRVVIATLRSGGRLSRTDICAQTGLSASTVSAITADLIEAALPPPLDPTRMQPSWALGILGMPGFTAYMGLTDIGQPKPGETVVVAAASGAVGSVVGQVAKLLGCRVVGIAGGTEKCDYVVDTLGFDACIDHRQDDLPGRLADACPDGIDVYFENVGGKVFDAVLPLLNTKARIPLCGLIATYNATELPPGPDRMSVLTGTLLKKSIRMQGFIVFNDYGDRYGEFLQTVGPWVAEGKLHYREDVVDGLEHAAEGLIGMLEGQNFGKLVVRVGPDDLA